MTDVYMKFSKSLNQHIKYVREAGSQLKSFIDKADLPEWERRMESHDDSKWSPEEFKAYGDHFFGEGDSNGFVLAWLHHIHHNDHHWQHWIFPDGYKGPEDATNIHRNIVCMTPIATVEMIADWMGASRAYTGDWDMAKWLNNNAHKIKLHPTTAAYVNEILDYDPQMWGS